MGHCVIVLRMKEASPADSQPRKSGGGLARVEWDFSKVPVPELEACFAWEYGREWNLLRDGSLRVPSKTRKTPGGEQPNPEFNEFAADPDRWVGCLHGGMLIERWQQLNTPWQDMPAATRAEILKAGMTETAGLLELDSAPTAEAEWQRYQIVTLGVNWEHSDTRLIADFARWLRDRRQKPAREQRGRNRRDDLNMLGGVRLLHHMKLEEAIIETTRTRGEPIYGKRPSWARARKMALRVFLEDFLIEPKRWQEEQLPRSYAKAEKD